MIDGKLRGVAVHIGARVAGHAAPGEVLVSRTLRDLVTGSGITFESRGPADLGYPRRVGALRRDRAVAPAHSAAKPLNGRINDRRG